MNRRSLLKSGLSITAMNVVTTLSDMESAGAQARTVYEPSMNDPRILAALDTRKSLGAAMLARDFKTVEEIFAPDLLVHSPLFRKDRAWRCGADAGVSGVTQS